MTEVWSHYTPTRARPGQNLSRPRPTSGTIDVHSHIVIPAAAELAAPHLSKPNDGSSADTVALGRKQLAERRPHMVDLAVRIPDLDAMGIERQVIKPSPQQCYYDVPDDISVKAARLVNDGMAEFAAQRPDRLIPFGSVPMPVPLEAVAELERCVSELGFRGIQLLTNVRGGELSDPVYEPFWAKAEELGVLVVLHPAGFTEPRRLSRFYFGNVIGNPLDTTVAVHHLIFGGVLERYPNLRILAVHGGAYTAAYSGRLDHAWGARSDSHGALPRPPSHYLRKFYVDTVVFTVHQLEYLVRVFGADHVLMGTDYPFDMAEYDPVGHVLAAEALDDAAVTAIMGGNVRRLLSLD
jgi:aminocarboxymuconate-semialdehyde decarboxylase